MIDSGAGGSFISERFVKRHGIATRQKSEGYELIAADGSSLPDVDRETVPIRLVYQQHHENITLDVVALAKHDIILGMPWLRRHNPVLDWISGVLTFARCNCVKHRRPAHRQRSMADEVRELNDIQSQPTRTGQTSPPPTDTGQENPGQSRVRSTGGNHAPPDIPKEYLKWQRLFQEEVGTDALPPHQPWDCHIDLEPGTKPIWGPLYTQSGKELEATKEWIDKLLAKGWIRRSKSPFGAPILTVPKSNGKHRVVQDYRRLNEKTVKNRYPLPNIKEARDRLSGADWFTKLDLRDAFYSIRMADGEEYKTAFRTRYGLFEFLVMPQGFTNSPAVCQHMVNDVLRDLLDVTALAYVDDILIFTKGTIEQHVKDVQEVFKRLASTSFKTAPEKCEFHKKKVKFLGHIISTEGVEIDPGKIKSILEWPTPQSLKDVQSFLGLANYNRDSIEGYSKHAEPLTKLTRKETPFRWDSDQQKAFEHLKKATAEAPMLRIFDPSLPIQIETDASDRAIGACLTQIQDGKRRPLAYYSRKLTPPELNYDIHDKELLAIVAALMHWRIYAEGSVGTITILSDHKNLTLFTTTKVLTRRQVRWAELLGQYKFEVRYTPGKDNGRADALSRRSDYMEGKDAVEHSILKTNNDGSLSANTMELGNTQPLHEASAEQAYITGILDYELDDSGRMIVPDWDGQQELIIRDHHDDPLHGHPGIEKTVKLIRESFTFPGMKDKVTKYIKKCHKCQTNKSERHAKYGHIQFTNPPRQPWDEVTMDFITKLPLSKDPVTQLSYDSVLVMVDRLTKYSHFIPCNETYTAENLGYLVLDRLVRYHGIPTSFVTDRDKLFTSNFWNTLVACLGTKHKLSTAYHPTTDGQTERMNQTLEVYLRHYVNHTQDNWVSLLPTAQLALNNGQSATTKVSPFYANFGKKPNLFTTPRNHPQAQEAMTLVDDMKKLHELCSQNISKSQYTTAKLLQGKRKMAPQLKKGDKVYLLTKNLKTRRPTKKLDQVKVGPFLVQEVKGPQNYRLELPPDAHIHPVFHISLLEPADPSTPLQTTFHFQPEEEQEWEVDKILVWDGYKYLIRWKGYPDSENTWEPVTNLRNCMDKLKRFHSPGQEELTIDLVKGADEKDLAKLRPDLSSRPKFLKWVNKRWNGPPLG